MKGGRRAQILQKFDQINVWTRGDERAPDKPLLILYALGRWQRGQRSDLSFAEVNHDVGDLLRDFGPPRRSYHPEYPFWRLQTDGLWTVAADAAVEPRKGHTDPKKSDLLKHKCQWPTSPDPVLAARLRQTRRLSLTSPDGFWRLISQTPFMRTSWMPWGYRWSP